MKRVEIIVLAIALMAMFLFFVVTPALCRSGLPDIFALGSLVLSGVLSLSGSRIVYKHM